jgi:murein L,D-transpeptidase YcbB/YkuD
MKRFGISIAVCLCIASAVQICIAQEQASADVVSDPVGMIIEKLVSSKRPVAQESISAWDMLLRFYGERSFAPAWSGSNKATEDTDDLMKAIEASSSHGLNPDLYHKNAIEGIKTTMGDADENQKHMLLAQLDILMTDAFFTLASHLDSGLINPYFSNANQRKPVSNTDLVPVLTASLAAHDIGDALERLAPQTEGYKRLKKALAKMREIAAKETWPTVSEGKKLEPGAADQRIVAIRRRLEAGGDIEQSLPPKEKNRTQINDETTSTQAEPGEDYYDEKLKEAVIRFQMKYGLEPDGVIGKRTVDALNAQPDWRVCQIKINLDRLRAVNKLLSEERYALVNLPDFGLKVFENGQAVLDMKVIVGRLDRKSPLMSDQIRFIVFSPKWDVPTSIAVKDKLPEIKKDPSFIQRHGMKVYATGPTGIEEIEPEDVDWESVNGDNFSYHIVQAAGDENALGRVKFMFPNRHSVYLHDTPTKRLFEREARTYSSGCIRISDPIEFAKYLLKDKEEWDDERITAAMKRSTPLFVDLERYLPIHILYLTAWADENGDPVFRHDVYGFDRAQSKLFCKP